VNATSVNQCPWRVYRAETEVLSPDDDEWRPYNITVDKNHWFFDPAARTKVEAPEAR
jgi:hypothetical protein